MTGDDMARLLYLGLLLAALMGWFVVQSRVALGKMAQYAAAWGLIFLGAVAAVGLWQDVRRSVLPQQTLLVENGHIELPRAADGHYYVTLDLNGALTRFVVDTGATSVVLSQADATRAGFDVDNLPFFAQAMTANGPVQTAPVTLDSVALGPFTDINVPAYVNGGEMEISLLGMTYLGRFNRLEISNGRLILER